MRKKNREITDKNELISIIKKCDACRIAFFDQDFPYILPFNFGVKFENDQMELYFHCAKEGKKLDLIRANNRVGFEMDCSHRLITGEKACQFTMEYESIVGNGIITFLEGEEKLNGLIQLMKQYSSKEDFEFDDEILDIVVVFKLTVQNITGKRLKKNPIA
ncbi:MAG: pyridoxamine 5'-phosphate oxidase family protein [Clostridiales bacterium]|nr:pyridoxamine 5'-phosphate oxidase family protein [Clostridiales bacterium]